MQAGKRLGGGCDWVPRYVRDGEGEAWTGCCFMALWRPDASPGPHRAGIDAGSRKNVSKGKGRLMENNPFASLIGQTRSSKPRSRGITMSIDWGMSLEQQAAFLSVAHPYVDLAKVAVGISALLPGDLLRQKIEAYGARDITCFPGGQFLEFAVLEGKADLYMKACCEAGYRCIEVSDNLLDIALDDKCALIRRAQEEFGLRVIGEVGKKEGLAGTADLDEDAARCLESGALAVFLEAADFFSGDVKETELDKLVKRCGQDALIFELPGPYIEGDYAQRREQDDPLDAVPVRVRSQPGQCHAGGGHQARGLETSYRRQRRRIWCGAVAVRYYLPWRCHGHAVMLKVRERRQRRAVRCRPHVWHIPGLTGVPWER